MCGQWDVHFSWLLFIWLWEWVVFQLISGGRITFLREGVNVWEKYSCFRYDVYECTNTDWVAALRRCSCFSFTNRCVAFMTWCYKFIKLDFRKNIFRYDYRLISAYLITVVNFCTLVSFVTPASSSSTIHFNLFLSGIYRHQIVYFFWK